MPKYRYKYTAKIDGKPHEFIGELMVLSLEEEKQALLEELVRDSEASNAEWVKGEPFKEGHWEMAKVTDAKVEWIK